MFNLGTSEKHIKTVRRHWLVFLFGLLPFAFTAYITLLLQNALVAGQVWTPFGNVSFTTFPEAYVYSGAALLFLTLWLAAMHFVTDFYLDTWIVSNERIIGVTQKGFFSREINSFRIERIQDVQTDVHGFFPTIFGIGDVHVETAGHTHDLIMRTVGNPQGLRDIIMEEIRKRPGSLHDV